jgi:hypothetical protein
MDSMSAFAARNASVVGMPIPGFGGIDARTSEQDWVVTGSRQGQDFRLYVSPHVSRDQAIRAAVSALNLTPATLDWISAARRDHVEQCVRMDDEWLRSRSL